MSFSLGCFLPGADVVAIGTIGAWPQRRLHPREPDGCQSSRNLFRIKFLVFLRPEQLLDQEMIDHHSQEAPGREEKLNIAKCSLTNALLNVIRQRFVIDRHVSTEKPVR